MRPPDDVAEQRSSPACARCSERPAVACDECRRGLAFLDHLAGFASIARHPEQGTTCRLCERGDAELCVECLCRGVLDARATPDSPYAAPTLEQFEADRQRARDDVERVAAMNAELGQAVLRLFGPVQSLYDDRPSDRGPSWCRLVGW
jgi:hypothetical protein